MTDPKDIKAIAFDVDGVMTDGSLMGFDSGELVRTYNAKDTFAIRIAVLNGLKVAVITGGKTEGIRRRFLTCGVLDDDIHMNCRGKMKDFNEFCTKYSLRPEEVLYFGDDIPDVPVLKACGLGIAPCDAAEEAKEAADMISPYPGGKRCVRHGIEMVLKAQGKWNFDVVNYEKVF